MVGCRLKFPGFIPDKDRKRPRSDRTWDPPRVLFSGLLGALSPRMKGQLDPVSRLKMPGVVPPFRNTFYELYVLVLSTYYRLFRWRSSGVLFRVVFWLYATYCPPSSGLRMSRNRMIHVILSSFVSSVRRGLWYSHPSLFDLLFNLSCFSRNATVVITRHVFYFSDVWLLTTTFRTNVSPSSPEWIFSRIKHPENWLLIFFWCKD